MSERLREVAVAGAIVALVVLGLALDVGGQPRDPAPSESPGPGFVQRSLYCPVPPDGTRPRAALAATVDGQGRAEVPVEVGEVVTTLSGRRMLVARSGEEDPSSVTGFGAPLAATGALELNRPPGAGATACTGDSSSVWYFPEGSSSLDSDERIVVFNPYLDESVVRVSFLTATGPKTKANLSDVSVAPGSSVEIAVNDYVFRQRLLAAVVTAKRGRVVAWRELVSSERGAKGLQLSLGAAETHPTWYFPDGGIGKGYDERITLLNPSEDEALVTITVVTGDRVVQPPRLVELSVPPQSARRVALVPAVGGPGRARSVSALVTSTNGTGIVAERTVRYSTRDAEGVESEMGAPLKARAWFLGPASLSVSTDALTVLNPGSEDAIVSVVLADEEGSLTPSRLRSLSVPAGLRIFIPIGEWTRGRRLGALLTSDREVVAERRSYSEAIGDVASVVGVPLTRTGDGS